MNELNTDRDASRASARAATKTNINLPLAPGIREAIDELRGPSETRVGFIRSAIERELKVRSARRKD